MARFMVTRTLPPLTEDELTEVGKRVVEVCNEMDGVEWLGSHLTADGKHSFCKFEAPDAESVRKHARRSGLPVDDVFPLGGDIGPSMFK